jgi:hypothetical protein
LYWLCAQYVWLSARDCKLLCVIWLCKVRLCAIEELALCLDLILGKVDLVHCAQITCPVRILALWLCAHERRNVRRLKANKEEEEVG